MNNKELHDLKKTIEFLETLLESVRWGPMSNKELRDLKKTIEFLSKMRTKRTNE